MLDINLLNSHLSFDWTVESFCLSLFPAMDGVITESVFEFDMVIWMNANPIPVYLLGSPLNVS